MLNTYSPVVGESVDFADDYTEALSIDADTSITIVIPENGHYLFAQVVTTNDKSTGLTLQKSDSTKEKIKYIQTDLYGGAHIISSSDIVDLTELDLVTGCLQSNRWLSDFNQSLFIDKNNENWGTNNAIQVVGGDNTTVVLFTKAEIPNSTISEKTLESTYYSTGNRKGSVFSILADETKEIFIPAETEYIYINKTSDTNKKPKSFNFLTAIEGINTNKKIKELEIKVNKIENAGTDTYFNSNKVDYDIANSVGNDLLPLQPDVDANGHLVPKTIQHLNVQNKAKEYCLIQWTCKKNVPYRHDTDDGEGESEGAFVAGETITGLPYSSVKELDKYIGFDVTVHTFMTAVNNPFSLLYTENVSAAHSKSDWGIVYHGINCATYYGTVCSEFSSYSVGMPNVISTGTHEWLSKYAMRAVRLYNQTEKNMQIGDILVRYNKSTGKAMHCMTVVDIIRNSSNEVTLFWIAESTGEHVKYTSRRRIAETNYNIIVYRYLGLYRNIGYEDSASEFIDLLLLPNPIYNLSIQADIATVAAAQKAYSYNNDICTFAGDKACFAEGDLVVINYNLENEPNFAYNAIEVYKDDILLETYNMVDIDQSELPENQVGHALKLGTTLIAGDYKARCTDGNGNYSDYTYWEVINTTNVNVSIDENSITLVTFNSLNGIASRVCITSNNGGVICSRGLTQEELLNGEIRTNFVRLAKEQHNVDLSSRTDTLYLKLSFKGKYGRARIVIPYMNIE